MGKITLQTLLVNIGLIARFGICYKPFYSSQELQVILLRKMSQQTTMEMAIPKKKRKWSKYKVSCWKRRNAFQVLNQRLP
jgi:hypothetical protein